MTAETGDLVLSEVIIRGAHAEAPLKALNTVESVSPNLDQNAQELIFESCLPDPRCDDGARLQALINSAPSEPVFISPSQVMPMMQKVP